MIRKLFRKKKVLDPIDLSVLKVDMHSHLIPRIDDGSPSSEISLQLLKRFEALGYQKVITTPHTMVDYYKNTTEIIQSGASRLKQKMSKAGLKIELDAASEYFMDEHFDKLVEQNDLLTFGKNYVLFELPMMSETSITKSVLFKLQMAGYRPILAHPERYAYWHREPAKLREFHDRDILLQVNINSLTGTYSPGAQKTAEWLIDQGLVDFVGTDCHHGGHLDLLNVARTLPYLHKVIESGKLKNHELI